MDIWEMIKMAAWIVAVAITLAITIMYLFMSVFGLTLKSYRKERGPKNES